MCTSERLKLLIRFTFMCALINSVFWRAERVRPKLILFTTRWFHTSFPLLKDAYKICPKCVFTTDENYFNSSDAVVFHGVYLSKKPPAPRPKNQIWVWMFFETPAYLGRKLENMEMYKNQFNWTMTYRRDSDIFVPYGKSFHIKETPYPATENHWAYFQDGIPNKLEIPTITQLKKRKFAAWIVSNCKSPSNRENIVKELAKYIDIDIYGDCGNFTCTDESKGGQKIGMSCRSKISDKYKFYLSFENSLCEDYVTEKFFDTLFTQMIPIVYGAANYTHFAPPHSYISLSDFGSVKDLAKYLIYLYNNHKEFLKYFEWRKHHWVQNSRFISGYCDLCNKIWQRSEEKSYEDIKTWWFRKSDFIVSAKNACF